MPTNPQPRRRQAAVTATTSSRSARRARTVPGPLAWQSVLQQLRTAAATSGAPPAGYRVFECVCAGLLLLLSLPVILIMTLIVRLDSPGPAMFRQWRVGRNGRLFRFTKFRTLYADARERWPELYAYQYTEDELRRLYFKVPDDPRVTRVGQWLRKSTLDELPNLWHVLTGEMALVGPRPEIPEMLPYYDSYTLRKFTVRPGVTGLAQVSGRGRLTFHETAAYDVEYVNRRSLGLDLKILARTVCRTLCRDGAF